MNRDSSGGLWLIPPSATYSVKCLVQSRILSLSDQLWTTNRIKNKDTKNHFSFTGT